MTFVWGWTRMYLTPIIRTVTNWKPPSATLSPQQPGSASENALNAITASNQGARGTVWAFDGLPLEAVVPHYSAFKYHPGNPLADKVAPAGTTDISCDSVELSIINAGSAHVQQAIVPVDLSIYTHAGVDFTCFGFVNVPTMYTVGSAVVCQFTPDPVT